jgi:homocysteine S-methyltransferase
VVGVGANPGAIDNEQELRRFFYKVEAGAEFALTQPVFDPAVLERFLKRTEGCKIPVIVGILPLASHRMAEFLNNEVPGCSVPVPILDRMRRADQEGTAREEGIHIAREIFERVQEMVQGVQIRGPFENYETAIEVLSIRGDR